MIGLCFGASIAVHAGILLSMWLSPVPPASAWSRSSESVDQREQHVVQVTLMFSAPSFTPPIDPPSEQPSEVPVEPVPPVPVAVPKLPQGPTDAPRNTQPTTAKPPAPDEPIADVPDPEQPEQPLALDLPTTQASDAPLPSVAETGEPEATTPPKPNEAEAEALKPTAQEPIDQPVQPTDPAKQTSEQTASKPEETKPTPEPPSAPQEPVEAPEASETQPEPPVEPATQDTETSDPADEQPETLETESDAPAAVVFDEDSVDQRVAFEKKARPKQSMISKRRGESGTVRILIEVDQTGTLVGQQVIDDAGYPRLLKAAISALQDSTFQPAIRDGKPVRSTRVIEYRF